jgi:hypothetical protein
MKILYELYDKDVLNKKLKAEYDRMCFETRNNSQVLINYDKEKRAMQIIDYEGDAFKHKLTLEQSMEVALDLAKLKELNKRLNLGLTFDSEG